MRQIQDQFLVQSRKHHRFLVHVIILFDGKNVRMWDTRLETPFKQHRTGTWSWPVGLQRLPQRRRSGCWDWGRWEFVVDVPKAARAGRLQFTSAQCTGHFCIDDVRMQRISAAGADATIVNQRQSHRNKPKECHDKGCCDVAGRNQPRSVGP